jgi:hypothetical protein
VLQDVFFIQKDLTLFYSTGFHRDRVAWTIELMNRQLSTTKDAAFLQSIDRTVARLKELSKKGETRQEYTVQELQAAAYATIAYFHKAESILSLLEGDEVFCLHSQEILDDYEMNYIALSAYLGEVSLVRRFVKAKMELEGLDKFEDLERRFNPYLGTPLIAAVAGGHQKVVTFLLSEGADVSQTSPGSGRPLWIAVRRGDLQMMSLLVHNGGSVHESRV